jgi:phosphomannomutase
VVSEVAERLGREGVQVLDLDGVRVRTEDGWWLLRASNTQPALTARCEASTSDGLERLKHILVARLAAAGVAAPDFSGEAKH